MSLHPLLLSGSIAVPFSGQFENSIGEVNQFESQSLWERSEISVRVQIWRRRPRQVCPLIYTICKPIEHYLENEQQQEPGKDSECTHSQLHSASFRIRHSSSNPLRLWPVQSICCYQSLQCIGLELIWFGIEIQNVVALSARAGSHCGSPTN